MSFTSNLKSAIENKIISTISSAKIFGEYYKRTESKAPWKREAINLQKKVLKD